MGYVAVTAGEEIIGRAEDLFEKQRLEGDSETLSVDQLDDQLSRLTAQAMSEGGLYAPRLAALAVKQAQGDTVEAAFLLRAYRSTLERWEETEPVDPDELFATRRVSPAYKDVPGGQILGPTKDYTQRLLDFDLDGEANGTESADGDDAADEPSDPTADWDLPDGEPTTVQNVMEVLRDDGLVHDPDETADGADEGADADGADDGTDDEYEEPADTTREPVTHPPDRDEVLQELARGETGAVTALGYSAMRGYGQVHPTLAEVRVGKLPVRITHPYTGDAVRVTDAEVTESEAVVPVYEKREDPQFAFGYGLSFGRNERKAIAMTILDASIQLDGADEPAENPEFVLDTVDGMDSFGFIEHLKLPHYVTFQSILDRIRAIRERGEIDGADADVDGAPEADADVDGAPEADDRPETDDPVAATGGDDD
ncbi:carbon-phosphorus lyase complex subunit PhnI [Halosimplex litoreum]|uniref:Carbon-phosphorus lyase complex subunit PhnI n=1 Tax=Halosimplex litoreum TaxID=1198301 RepID=A0A7T3FZ62_9EURY|nr:carbon-phosphorus lyase complex subunit PhnI [Halosimplex litoreum]QPV63326.1 carbon-phosphorus lyase complex subunit PhnI [Halosimplex litoreum]